MLHYQVYVWIFTTQFILCHSLSSMKNKIPITTQVKTLSITITAAQILEVIVPITTSLAQKDQEKQTLNSWPFKPCDLSSHLVTQPDGAYGWTAFVMHMFLFHSSLIMDGLIYSCSFVSRTVLSVAAAITTLGLAEFF